MADAPRFDPRRLRPGELCRILNSTPLGEVTSERVLQRHRNRAGLRIDDGTGKGIDLFRYVAWLAVRRERGAKPDPAVPSGLSGYELHRERARQRNAQLSLSGRDIGELPEVADPARKGACRADFRSFCERYFPQTFRLAWSEDHLRVIGRIENAVLEGGLFAMAMPRGSGKTSLCETACLWSLLYGHREFVALIGSDEEHAASMLESIKAELENNDLLLDDFPEVCFPIRSLEGIHQRAGGQLHLGKQTHIGWTAREIVLPSVAGSPASGAVVRVGGITGRIRGMKHKRPDGASIRPSLVLIDDPQTDESARSPSQCANRERILAGAYNAFIDAAVDLRTRQGRGQAVAGPLVESAQRGIGVVLVRNDSDELIEPHHALAITGVLVEPGEDDQERTFHSRTPLTGDVATEESDTLAFAVAVQPIKPNALGPCVLTGVTTARVYITNDTDTTCELAADETVLASTPMGGIPILWKEDGTGEKWAVIELGRPSPGRITAILGAAQPIPTERNRWRYPWVEAQIDGNPGSETYLRYVAIEGGLSSQLASGGEDPTRLALNRFEAHHMNDSEPGSGFGGLLGLGPVCELPGVLPKCPPARSLKPKLVPIPEGVCVQLTCERNSKGKPVWVFEAMSLIEIADPADEDRKFNLYIGGAE